MNNEVDNTQFEALKRDNKILQIGLNEMRDILEEKDKEITKAKEKLKKCEKAKKDQDIEIKKVNAHLKKCFDDIKEIEEENGKLKATNRLLKGNLEALEETLSEKHKKETGEYVQSLFSNKSSGYRRDTPAAESSPADGKKHICRACNHEEKTQKDLMEHIKNHSDKCKDCGTVFMNSAGLKRHMNLYHAQIGQKCSDCNYIAGSDGQLNNHIYFKHLERAEIPPETQVCRYFIMNSCRFGSNCRFRHIKICRFQNNCRWGSSCNFYHMPDNQVPSFRSQEQENWKTPCREFNEGRCMRPNCQFTHFLANRRFYQDRQRELLDTQWNQTTEEMNPMWWRQQRTQEMSQMWRPW